MKPVSRAQAELHLCVVLWGFTSILGKLITLPAFALVWWRMLLVACALLLLPSVWRGLFELKPKQILALGGIGVVLALHWWTFYGAIKLANASVAATCIGLAPVFVALIEPAVAHRPFRFRELLVAIAAVPGVALVVGGTPPGMRIGVLVGAASALLVAGFSSYNKRLIEHADPLTMTTVEFAAGLALLTALTPLHTGWRPWMPLPSLHDAVLLLVLATVCTLLPFALALRALRHLSAYRVQLLVNLEPVYSVVLAAAFLHEQHELGGRFYLGVLVIVGAVFAPQQRQA